MVSRCYRWIHRARSRSQRVRIYGWIVVLVTFFLLVLLTQQQSQQEQQQQQQQQIEQLQQQEQSLQAMPRQNILLVDRSERALSRKAASLKMSQDVKNYRVDTGLKNPPGKKAQRSFMNEMGEEEEDDQDDADLQPDLAAPVVHFLWCGGQGRKFEYRHYLAIRRACAVIKPDKIVLHHQGLPVQDIEGYYTWFNQTLSETTNLVVRRLDTNDLAASEDTSDGDTQDCPVEPNTRRFMLILRLLSQMGGVYVPEDAILVDFPLHLRAASFVSGATPLNPTHFSEGLIVARKGGVQAPSTPTELLVVLASGRSTETSLRPCGTVQHFDMEEDADCICVRVDREIFPADIWGGAKAGSSHRIVEGGAVQERDNNRSYHELTDKGAESNFLTLARMAGYGVRSVGAKPSSRGGVPRIAHYICWDCDLKFGTYLSIMSSLYVAGLTKVYVHGIKPPSGIWWNRLQDTQRVIHVHREYPEHSVERATLTSELALGILRVAILLKYGGVYCDDRVIWTNQIPDELFSYEAVASPGWHSYGPWPDSVSHSTILAKKNSAYLKQLRMLHAQNRKQRFWFVDQFLSYKIVEKQPEVLRLDRHLQVTCVNHNCHPTWLPGYKAPLYENPPGHGFSWQNETLSILWDVFPSLELDTVKFTSGVIVDVARRVLSKAGVSLLHLTTV